MRISRKPFQRANLTQTISTFKNARKWDDALDVWGVHGMGGLTGAILTGTLASPHIWDTGDGIGAWTGTPEGYEQQAISIVAAGMSIAYAFGVSVVIFKVMDAVWPGGIRVTPKEEEEDVRNEIMQNALEEALDKLDKPAGRLIRRLAR